MKAQGEDPDDRWVLRIVDGRAVKIDTPPAGIKTTCPECGHTFYAEESKA